MAMTDAQQMELEQAAAAAAAAVAHTGERAAAAAFAGHILDANAGGYYTSCVSVAYCTPQDDEGELATNMDTDEGELAEVALGYIVGDEAELGGLYDGGPYTEIYAGVCDAVAARVGSFEERVKRAGNWEGYAAHCA